MSKYLLSGIVAIALAFALGSSGVDAQTVMFTRNLTVGSRGNDVAALQAWLIGRGYTIPAITFGNTVPGYFGTETKTAVTAYQRANGIPSTGFFGPLTIASVNAQGGNVGVGTGNTNCPTGFTCTPTTTTPNCPTGFICTPSGGNNNNNNQGGLRGNFGTIEDVSELSQFNNEEVGEGEEDVRVLGFEIETSNEGDVLIRSMRVVFDPNDTSGSTRLERYLDRVVIMQGDREVGTADVEDFDENNDDVYTATIVLNNAIVRSDATEDFYISLDAASNLDSEDINNDAWTIDIDSIRYEDASGVVTTESSVGDIGQMDVEINFVDFGESSDTELQVSKDNDSPEEGIVIIDDSGEDDVVLLRGSIEIEGTSDVNIDEIPVTLTTSGVDVDSIINTLTIDIDGNEYSENVTSASSTSVLITFNDLDLDVEAGDTIEFTIMGDINELDDFPSGTTLVASLTPDNVDDIDAENEQGDQLEDGEKTGSAIGEEQQFLETGIAPRLITTGTSVTTNQNANDDIGSFRIRFSITAVGDSVYIDSDASGYDYTVERSGSTVGAGTSATIVNVTDDDETSNGNFLIEEGETETFELTITAQLPTAGTSGQYRALLNGIDWDTDDDSSLDNTYTTNLTQFRTSYAVLN